MPAWIIITEGDLNDARVAELITALREEALGVGQADPMANIVTKVVNEVRSCIGFCATTILDADPAKIPANLKDMVVQKIVRTMKGRLQIALSDDETKEESVYQSRIKLLTECAWPVDKTDAPIGTTTTQPSGGSVELASAGTRKTRGLDRL